MKHIILIGLIIIMSSCEKDGEGTVSFGSNDDLLNCIHEAYVFIDGIEVGIIPGYCDSIIDCSSASTLNYAVKEGSHEFVLVVENRQGGTCYYEITGEFEVDPNKCVKIYYDVVEGVIRDFSTQH